MKTFLPKCLAVAFPFLVLFSACKQADPVSSNDVTWKMIPMPGDALADTATGYGLAVPANGTIYLTCPGHMYTSGDGGTVWSESSYPIDVFGSGDTVNSTLSVAPNGVLFASATVAAGSGVRSVLHRLHPNEISWENLQVPGTLDNKTAIGTPVFASNGAMYLATTGYVYYSADNGSSWSAVLTTNSANGIPCIASAPGNVLYAGVQMVGMLRSTNNGATWDTINTGLPSFASAPDISPVIIGVSPAGTIYMDMAYTKPDGTLSGSAVFCSNSGAAWQRADTGLPMNAGLPQVIFLKNTNALICSTGGNFISVDGVHWSAYGLEMPTNEYRIMGVDARQILYIGDLDGIYKTTQPID